MSMTKLDMEGVAESIPFYADLRDLGTLQTVVRIMCGGGPLGWMAATQPSEFYIDSRVGRLPYPRKAILQAVMVLQLTATAKGLDPKRLPDPPDFHNCGIF